MKNSEVVEDKVNNIIKQIGNLDINNFTKEKVIEILRSSIEEDGNFIDITLETQINKLLFNNKKGLNNSIITGLQQDFGIYTVEDLIKLNIDENSSFLSKIPLFTNSNLFKKIVKEKIIELRVKLIK